MSKDDAPKPPENPTTPIPLAPPPKPPPPSDTAKPVPPDYVTYDAGPLIVTKLDKKT